MGINIGAFLSPLACGYVGERINWHWGFGLAGIGMTLGLIQYVVGWRYLGEAGLYPAPPENADGGDSQKRTLWIGIFATAAALATLALLSTTGVIYLTAQGIANIVGI